MKNTTVTLRLDEELARKLDSVVAQSGCSRSEVAREALERQLRVLSFEELRKRVMPVAEASGYLTDEDVFRDIS